MKLLVLGTGNGTAMKCYNTCFVIENQDRYFLVDGGGGNQILTQIEKANLDITRIKDIFISHIHTDHILGLIWVVRKIVSKIRFGNSYVGNLNIYGGKEGVETLRHLIDLLFPPARQFFDNRIIFNSVIDQQKVKIIDLDVEFLDTKSEKEEQFGLIVNNEIAFTGDEPIKETVLDRVQNKKWLLHESFCLENEVDVFKPYEKGHGTVKDAAKVAQQLNIQNLVLWHTEDNNINQRKELYSKEAKEYFKGKLFVPNDLDVIQID